MKSEQLSEEKKKSNSNLPSLRHKTVHYATLQTVPLTVHSDAFCCKICSLTSNCEICVADGNRCHLGNITTLDGSVSVLGDKHWNLYLNSGKILLADHLLGFQES
jgi:hypothetical protein